ncbi:hypothetical protein NDU88_003075 [Pleurodeles waltl]|uniref:Uncharacterized protein n=1 Tax=Pleurodeles waltl TaxID=8319 RepID=A0AAV7V0N5_PLEWA|nr:hypothetical protein NDU88_003075 [Pleurodeles waltl]
MGQVIRDSIPHHLNWTPRPINDEKTYEKCKSSNDKASRRRTAKASDLQIGDFVLMKDQTPGSKFRLPFEHRPWIIVQRQGTIVVARCKTEEFTRNISAFKCYYPAMSLSTPSPRAEPFPDRLASPAVDAWAPIGQTVAPNQEDVSASPQEDSMREPLLMPSEHKADCPAHTSYAI